MEKEMESHEEQDILEKSLRINRIIWVAIFCSLPVYLFIAVFLDREKLISPDLGLSVNTLSIALFIVSVVTLLLTYLIRKKLLEPGSFSAVVTGSDGKPVSRTQHAAARYTGAIIISAALSESIGIYGFVLFLVTKEFLLFCEFLFLSAVGLILYRPRKDELMTYNASMRTKG